MALFHKAGRTRSRARLVNRAEGRSIALIPSAGLARCFTIRGWLFRGAARKAIGRWEFGVCKLFTLDHSGAYSAACPVIGGPYNLKQLGLLESQDFYS
jgi:hypothetical protein